MEKGPPHGDLSPGQGRVGIPFPWKYLLFIDLLLLCLLILATRLATLLHESVGHGFTAWSLGGLVQGVRLSLFGGGKTYYQLPTDPGLFPSLLAALGGILVNLATGWVSFRWVRELNQRPAWSLFVILLGMVSLLGGIAYLTLGFYYNMGDPVAWIRGPSSHAEWAWIPLLALCPIASFIAVKPFAEWVIPWFPTKMRAGRLGILVLTLGVTGGLYALLYGVTGQRSLAMDTPSIAYQRAVEELRSQKKEELRRRIRMSLPRLSEGEIEGLVQKTPVEIRPDEIPQGIPLKPMIAFLYAMGALFAAWKPGLHSPGPATKIGKGPLVLTLALAGTVLAILSFTEGWIWGRP